MGNNFIASKSFQRFIHCAAFTQLWACEENSIDVSRCLVQDAGCLPGTQTHQHLHHICVSSRAASYPANPGRKGKFSFSITVCHPLHFTAAVWTHFHQSHVVVRNTTWLFFPSLFNTSCDQSARKIVCAFNVLWGENEKNMRKWALWNVLNSIIDSHPTTEVVRRGIHK